MNAACKQKKRAGKRATLAGLLHAHSLTVLPKGRNAAAMTYW
jgi:hypothetical protein